MYFRDDECTSLAGALSSQANKLDPVIEVLKLLHHRLCGDDAVLRPRYHHHAMAASRRRQTRAELKEKQKISPGITTMSTPTKTLRRK